MEATGVFMNEEGALIAENGEILYNCNSAQENERNIDNSVAVSRNVAVEKARWSRSATLCIIESYKNFEKDFSSDNIRREIVWRKVQHRMEQQNFHFSHEQCEWKFKSLKRKYIKKKDNAGASSSGASRYDFEYFEEMNEIFDKHPICQPVAISSSMRENIVEEHEELEAALLEPQPGPSTVEDTEPTTSRRRGRKRPADLIIDELKTMENNRRVRHQELLQTIQEGQRDFKDLMEKLINKLG